VTNRDGKGGSKVNDNTVLEALLPFPVVAGIEALSFNLTPEDYFEIVINS
jgi:hypothetical protein